MKPSPKLLQTASGLTRSRDLLLVASPETKPRPRRELPFLAAITISCLAVAVLAFAGSHWVFASLTGADEVAEVAVFVLADGERPVDDDVRKEVRILSEAMPSLVSMPQPTLAPAEPPLLESPSELPVVTEIDPLEMEEVLAAARVPFPEALVVEKNQPKANRVATRVARAPTPKSRVKKAPSRPKPATVKRSARLVKRVNPTYPHSARRAGTEGSVTLLLTVDVHGHVCAAKVAKSSGSRVLDQAALAAVRRWTFRPATSGGRAVLSQVSAPVTFRLD